MGTFQHLLHSIPFHSYMIPAEETQENRAAAATAAEAHPQRLEEAISMKPSTATASSAPNWLRRWWKSNLADPLILILRRGTEPKQLAFSAALGITLGIFPVCGVTVFLCGIAAAILGSRCHTPTLMLANFIATPVELSLIIPFLRFGEWMINSPTQFELTSDAFKKIISGSASRDLLLGVSHVVLGWLVIAPFVVAALYVPLVPLFRWSIRKFSVVDHKVSIRLGEISSQKAAIA